MLEYIEVNQHESICVVLEAFINEDRDAITHFNEQFGTYMREDAHIELSSFMIEDRADTHVYVAVDIDETEDRNFFVVAEYREDETVEYTYFDTFSEAYSLYTKRKEAILN